MDKTRYAVGQRVVLGILFVQWSDGETTTYDAVGLGVEWFRMSNDDFARKYGFNFNPHEWGIYERCRKIVYP